MFLSLPLFPNLSLIPFAEMAVPSRPKGDQGEDVGHTA